MSNRGANVVTASGGQPPDGNLEKRVTAIEAVLPTLATKADLAELRVEMRTENDRLRTEMHTESDKLRTELRFGYDKLHAEMQAGNEKLLLEIRAQNDRQDAALAQMRTEVMGRITVMHQALRADTRTMQASLFRWMVTTMLTMLVAFSVFFVGLGNLLLSHAPPFDPARTGLLLPPGPSALVPTSNAGMAR